MNIHLYIHFPQNKKLTDISPDHWKADSKLINIITD